MNLQTRKGCMQELEELQRILYSKLLKNWGFHPWVLLRVHVGHFLYAINAGRRKDGQFSHIPPPLRPRKSFQVKNVVYYAVYASYAFLLSLRFRKHLRNKFLLVGIAGHVRDRETNYHIYLNPFYEQLAAAGHSGEMLLIGAKAERGKISHLLSVLYRMHLNLDEFTHFRQKEFAFTNALMLNEYFVNRQLADAGELSTEFLKQLRDSHIFYKTFVHFLRIVTPGAIWSYNFYHTRINALIRAGNKLKLPTIEYQHSAISGNHFAYTKWHQIDEIADQLPNTYWLWNEADAKRIRENFYSQRHQPKVIVGGNLYLRQEKKRILGVGLSQTFDPEKSILVALQGIWIPSFVEEVVAALPGWTWYFRLHPRYPADKENLFKLKQQMGEQVEVELANSLPIYELFCRVKFNITCFSGTALEAHDFGIRNIIFGTEGYSTYHEYITAGEFDYVDSAVQLIRALQDASRVPVMPTNYLDEAQLNENIQALLRIND